MKEVTLFTGKTTSVAEVIEQFADMEQESQKLAHEISGIETRLRDAETILSVIGTEDKNRVAAYQKALVDERTEEAKTLSDEINKVRATVFEKTNEVEGLTKLLDEKWKASASLLIKLSEKPYLLALAELYPLYDVYNRQAPELAATLRKMLDAFRKCEETAKAAGINMPRHIHPEHQVVDFAKFPAQLPKIFYDRDTKPLHSEADFWNSLIYLEETNPYRNR